MIDWEKTEIRVNKVWEEISQLISKGDFNRNKTIMIDTFENLLEDVRKREIEIHKENSNKDENLIEKLKQVECEFNIKIKSIEYDELTPKTLTL